MRCFRERTISTQWAGVSLYANQQFSLTSEFNYNKKKTDNLNMLAFEKINYTEGICKDQLLFYITKN